MKKPLSLALDIGATHTRLCALSPNLNNLFHLEKHLTPLRALPDLISLIQAYLVKHSLKPVRIGVSIAGQVTTEGLLTYAPNLNWSNIPLQEALQDTFFIPVSVRNDAQAATLAEWKLGGGKNLENLVCIWIGTGIGGGVIANGALLQGASQTAGEIGHLFIQGSYLEDLAGGRGIAKAAKEHLHHSISTEEVFTLAKNGHPTAQSILHHARCALIEACVNIVHLLNPQKIILGGALAAHQGEWLKNLEEGVSKKILPQASQSFTISPSSLGENAPLIGSLLLL